MCAKSAQAAETQTKKAAKREAAEEQFARAEKQRATLNGEPTEKRTLAEYKSGGNQLPASVPDYAARVRGGGCAAVRRGTLHGDG